MTDTAYRALEARFRRLTALAEAEQILHWDLATMMPPGGAESRAEQLATLAALRHRLLVDTETAELIDAATIEAKAEGGFDAWRQANLREMRWRLTHATAIGEDLVDALSRARSACETVWREARPAGDFGRVRPYLARVLDLVREVAAAKAGVLNVSRYDALLDGYEPQGRSERIDALFADLEAFLPGFIAEVTEHQARQPRVIPPRGPFPVERQRELGVRLMRTLGFDFDHGRLDVSLHPFCGGTPEDVRLTTRYDADDFTSGLMGVLHETGHALYDRGLPREWRGQPVGDIRGMSIHESQSLLIEMQACRSREFLRYAAPLMAEAFGHDAADPAWDPENLYRLYTRVEPGFIRVDADEVTYPAHVILRYRLERALVEGDMEVADIPAAWNEGMERLLGIVPPSDREGCLQDIHWFDAEWGYFPTYTLGAMTAAQLFDAARAADDDVVPGIARGDFAPLLRWLRANIHGKGSLLSTDDLVAEATGRPLDAEVFKRHLRRRYLDGA